MAIATNYFTGLQALQEGLLKGQQVAAHNNRSALVSYSQSIPGLDALDFFSRARQLTASAFFWERADDSFSMAGAGAALTLQGEGNRRFEAVEEQWQTLLAEAVIERSEDITDEWGIGPALVGGFSFDAAHPESGRWQGFPAGQMVLPRVQVVTRADGCYLTINVMVEAGVDALPEAEQLQKLCGQLCSPVREVEKSESQALELADVMPAQSWQHLVARAVQNIKQGAFQKVVLAREVHARANSALDLRQALERLRANYPSATLFAVAAGERCFLGATPERLVRLLDGEVRTIGLAGSARRGATEQEDQALGQELLESQKNLEEHAIVVRMLRQALEKVCSYVWAEDRPHLLKLSNVQHLYTPVLGRLPEGSDESVLKLVEQLHPTPALGGFPRTEAMAWLRENEGLDRGWYAAPVGWVDSRGEGEFVVAIRSALVEGNEAYLYAGCGIVADSDPESEYAESCLKLKPMLNALGF